MCTWTFQTMKDSAVCTISSCWQWHQLLDAQPQQANLSPQHRADMDSCKRDVLLANNRKIALTPLPTRDHTYCSKGQWWKYHYINSFVNHAELGETKRWYYLILVLVQSQSSSISWYSPVQNLKSLSKFCSMSRLCLPHKWGGAMWLYVNIPQVPFGSKISRHDAITKTSQPPATNW